MNINYDHKLNPHRLDDGTIVVPILFGDHIPQSVLDVGCGTGTWTKAARDNGVKDIFGIDGNNLTSEALITDADFELVDLTQPWDLGRRFEMLFCLEVAEHLDESCAEPLIKSLVRHAENIAFSAACPGQAGQHHVNCQWPEYWQNLFNAVGYACSDPVRPKIWADQRIAPWYRQNMFVATHDPDLAGHEPRIRNLLHPEIFGIMQHCTTMQDYQNLIDSGALSWKWYATVPFKALFTKVKNRIFPR